MKTDTTSHYIFRAYDIRGIVGVDLDSMSMLRIGRAVGIYSKSRFNIDKIIIGRDIRKTSDMLALAMISGLLETGVDVYDLGVLPVGVLLKKLFTLKGTIGAYVTASHLPPEYNGLKLMHYTGMYFDSSDITRIKEIFMKNSFHEQWDTVGKYHVVVGELENYINHLSAEFSDLKGINVAIDCGNGATCLTAPRIFKNVAGLVIELNCDIDPYFRARGAEPTPENIVELVRIVKSRELDFGVAYDGDGDRALFVDCSGRFLSPEEVAIVLIEGLDLRGDIVASIDCSRLLEDYAESRGLKVYRSRVGHNFVIKKMADCNAIIGVERSGHIALSTYRYADDGVLISLLVGRAIQSLGRKYTSLIESRYHMKSTKLKVHEQLKIRVMEHLKERIESMEEGKITLIDGVKLDLEEGWVLIRPSNTEPVVRITVEAKNPKKLDELFKKYVEICKQTIELASRSTH